jgi:hypothetical protein
LFVRRNRIWDSLNGVVVKAGTTADVRLSNNSVIGGLVAGGNTTAAYNFSAAGAIAVENNLCTGANDTALAVNGITAGNPTGYVERGNAFDTSNGQALQWNGMAQTPDQYLAAAGDGGSAFGDPQVRDITPANPDFTLQSTSPVRDIGVTDPATGVMTPSCDGTAASYCGAAPDPGAVELP